jgi:hypothetical protein
MRRGSVSVLVFAWAAAAVAVLAGCANASGRFQEFEARRVALDGDAGAAGTNAFGGAGGEGSCHPPAPGIVHGPALLALETTTTPGAAVLFWGEVETPELAGQTAVKYSYRALALSDRKTQVGDPLVVGPYAIADDGSFDAQTAASTLPGSADALLPGVPITSQLTLHGTICGISDFYCGSVTGNVTAPITGPTTGQFGLMLLPSIDDIPERPRYGCAEDALAEPLEPTSQ